ncbi:MAG: hypothetical protein ACOYLE_12365 [Bacteroidales bacterium]|jgi:hypothetical protein
MENQEWKDKALQRTIENKQLKKRIKELKNSRDSWKEKSVEYKLRADKMELHLKKTKKLIEKIATQT